MLPNTATIPPSINQPNFTIPRILPGTLQNAGHSSVRQPNFDSRPSRFVDSTDKQIQLRIQSFKKTHQQIQMAQIGRSFSVNESNPSYNPRIAMTAQKEENSLPPEPKMIGKKGPPNLGDLLGSEVNGEEQLGDIFRQLSKTAGSNLKQKRLECRSRLIGYNVNKSLQVADMNEDMIQIQNQSAGFAVSSNQIVKKGNNSLLGAYGNSQATTKFTGKIESARNTQLSSSNYHTKQDFNMNPNSSIYTPSVTKNHFLSLEKPMMSRAEKNLKKKWTDDEQYESWRAKQTMTSNETLKKDYVAIKAAKKAQTSYNSNGNIIMGSIISNSRLKEEIFDLPEGRMTIDFPPISPTMTQDMLMVVDQHLDMPFDQDAMHAEPSIGNDFSIHYQLPERIQDGSISPFLQQKRIQNAPAPISKSVRMQIKKHIVRDPQERKPILKNVAGQEFIAQSKKQYSPRKGLYKYVYETQRDELHDGMLNFSGGNKYFENGVAGNRMINHIQGTIRLSFDIQDHMKVNRNSIFDKMKKVKGIYIKNLLVGEENGHCKGIKQRMDPTIKYRLQQRMAKQKLLKEEQLEKIRRERELNTDKKQAELAMRTAEKIRKLSLLTTDQVKGESSIISIIQAKFLASKTANTIKEPERSGDTKSNDSISSLSESFQEEEIKEPKAVKTSEKTPNERKITFKKQGTINEKNQQKGELLRQIIDYIGLQGISNQSLQIMERNLVGSVLTQILSYYDLNLLELKNQKDNRQTIQPILQSSLNLGLFENSSTRNFFKSLSEAGDSNIKQARLKRSYLLQFLQTRYSDVVGERIVNFLESSFQSLYRIDFNGFLQVITDLLNLGPEAYQKMVFCCFSQKNPGIICEHDIFSIFEEFKQQDSYMFFKQLLEQVDVPRDYQHIVDKSDQIFFDVFISDLKQVNEIVTLQKQIQGVIPCDDPQLIALKEKTWGGKKQFENKVINDIDFILRKIAQKAPSSMHNEVALMLVEAQDVYKLKEMLCKFTSQKLSFEIKAEKKQGDKGRAMSPQNAQESQSQNQISFKVPSKINTCLGTKTNRGKPIKPCVFITFDDFQRFISFKGEHMVSSIVSDLLYTFTGGVFDLSLFERELSGFRDPSRPSFNKTLQFPKSLVSYMELENTQEASFDDEGSRINQKNENADLIQKQEPSDDVFIQKHKITEVLTIQSQSVGGEFDGMLLKRPKKKENLNQKSIQSQNTKQPVLRQESEKALNSLINQDPNGQFQLVPAETAQLLFSFRKHFGAENFINIYRVFYMLSNVHDESQNNPLQVTMDQTSCIRGFQFIFSLNIEELAVRFFKLFVQPEGHTKMLDITFLRFLFVTRLICQQDKESCSKMAFIFYDYDRNGSIGSVDIMNFIRHLDQDKIQKLNAKYQKIHLQKKELARAKKEGNLEEVKRKMNIVEYDEMIKEDVSDNDGSSISSSQSAVQTGKSTRRGAFRREFHLENVSIPFPTDHLKEDKINDLWNMVLFEAKVLRDYYVDKTVIPSATIADHDFLSQSHFVNKFLPLIRSLYLNVSIPEQRQYALKTPAIMNFFRQKLIICEKNIKGQSVYGEQMESEPGPNGKLVIPMIQRLQYKYDYEESMLVDECAPFMDQKNCPMTRELRENLNAIMKLTMVPNDIPVVSLD